VDGEAQYFSALCDRGRMADLQMVNREHLGPSWQPVYDFVLAFVREYRQLPNRVTVAGKFRCDLPDSIEPPTYYAQVVTDNAMRASMERGFEEKVVEPLGRTKPADALAGAQEVIADLRREFRPASDHLTLDMASNVDERIADYDLRRRSQNQVGIPYAWPTMTASTGGRQAGEGIVIASRPNKGKTWATVVDAQFCREIGYNCLFVSGETAPQAGKVRRKGHRVVRGVCTRCYTPGAVESEECPAANIRRQRLSNRFDAVGARVSAFRLLQGALQPQEYAQLQRYYQVCRDPAAAGYSWGRLKIISVPAITSVVDLEMAAEEFEPDAIWFDSAYVLANRYKGAKRNEAASRLIFDLKDTADRLGVPITISWHFNRDVNGDKDTNATQNTLALTDEISRLFDTIIGLFRPTEIEDAGEAIWQTLKVRDGIRMPELRTQFRMKQDIRFDEIGIGEPGEG